MCLNVCRGYKRKLEVESQEDVILLTWVLGTESGPLGKQQALLTLAISLAQPVNKGTVYTDISGFDSLNESLNFSFPV